MEGRQPDSCTPQIVLPCLPAVCLLAWLPYNLCPLIITLPPPSLSNCAADIEVLELNCQAASMVLRSTSLLHRRTEVPLEAAMRYVAEHYSDIWLVKSWNGNTAADGVLENSRGYALMRKSVGKAGEEQGADAAAGQGGE